MMKKTNFYYSFLLVACLLLFGFSFASAQTVTFQSKTAPRCSDVVLNVTITSPQELSAWEAIFQINGDYTSFSVAFTNPGALNQHIGPIINGNVVRMAGLKADVGDGCLDASGAGKVVATITVHTADLCPPAAIEIVGTSITTPVAASTGLVGCDPIVALTTTVVPGGVTIVNRVPTITCPGDQTAHWGDVVQFDVTYGDDDLATGCEHLTFDVIAGPGSINGSGHYSWATGGDDVCDHPVSIRVMDKCGAADTCSLNICVYNIPPAISHPANDTLFAVWDVTLGDQVIASDPDGGPSPLLYEVVSFDGPTWYGSGLQLNSGNGAWTWDIDHSEDYTGYFTLCIKASDGANVCSPCSPTNADTACYTIRVTGFAISIEKVHHQLQGRMADVSVYLDSAWANPIDSIGGFDFLIAYDASALSNPIAEPGALIAGKFEYFTYRHGPFGNCGSGCPSGLIRVVGLRETNNGVFNTNHIVGPGELVKLHFLVTNDYNYGCMFVPIRFFWIDCGDNTLSDETGNWLYLGLKVFDFLGNEITDPVEYGYSGPAYDCFDTVYSSEDVFKNAPLGAITFRDGGIDIICPDSIDDRGDVNLNGIRNEIADAVVFTNYFIYNLAAFTINVDGQIAATEVNGDGQALTVADLVYLIRIIVGDAQPLPKVIPDVSATFTARGDVIRVETNTTLGAALFVFQGHVIPTLAPEASHMELIYGHVDNTTRALIYGIGQGLAITSGEVLHVQGSGELVSVEAADYRGFSVKTNADIVPVAFELKQNYPNPFNPLTTIEMSLPVASEWTLSIFNVTGQKVAEFSGYSNPGIVTVEWDAGDLASGLYFYKAQAGKFSATRKMMLLK
jgi:hypothetical protein